MRGELPSKTRRRIPKRKGIPRTTTCSACIYFGDRSPIDRSDCGEDRWGLSRGCRRFEAKTVTRKEVGS